MTHHASKTQNTPVNTRTIELIRFDGPQPYRDTYRLQLARRNAIETGRASGALMLLEHTPVVTLGRNAREEHLLASRDVLARLGIEVVETDRGGDVTYHGPGQLVAYPVLDLRLWKCSIHGYLRALEDVLIAVLARHGLRGERMRGYTGVWVGGAKVAAIGVGIHRWVSYHGIALNVDPNMEHWGLIVPCGIPDKPVTSLRRLLGSAPSMEIVERDFVDAFRDRFNIG